MPAVPARRRAGPALPEVQTSAWPRLPSRRVHEERRRRVQPGATKEGGLGRPLPATRLRCDLDQSIVNSDVCGFK